MTEIAACHRLARDEKGSKKDPKEAKLKELLSRRNLRRPKVESVPLPLNPSIQLIGLEPDKTFMFASAIYPAVITFYEKMDPAPVRSGGGGGSFGSVGDDAADARSLHFAHSFLPFVVPIQY